MDLSTYQTATDRTAIYPEAGTGSDTALTYCILALGGEVGGLQNKWKKHLRGDDTPVDELYPLMMGEVGDVLYYAARVLLEMGYNFDEVAKLNLAKLADRKERGVLQGTGSNR